MTRIEDVNAARITALEEQGMSHSDAAAVAMAEDRGDYEAQAIAEVIEDDGSLDEYRRASHASRAADLDLVAQDWGIAGPSDTLEALAARFERNAADWRQVRGQPDLNDVKGAGYAAGMAEAYTLAAADIRRTLRGDPDWSAYDGLSPLEARSADGDR